MNFLASPRSCQLFWILSRSLLHEDWIFWSLYQTSWEKKNTLNLSIFQRLKILLRRLSRLKQFSKFHGFLMHLYILDFPKKHKLNESGWVFFLGGGEGLRGLTAGGMYLIVQGGGGVLSVWQKSSDFRSLEVGLSALGAGYTHNVFCILGKLNVECVFINLVSRVLHLPTPLSPWEQGCNFKKCIFISSIIIIYVAFVGLLWPAFNKE